MSILSLLLLNSVNILFVYYNQMMQAGWRLVIFMTMKGQKCWPRHKQEVFIFSAREDNYENTEFQIYLTCAYFLLFSPPLIHTLKKNKKCPFHVSET